MFLHLSLSHSVHREGGSAYGAGGLPTRWVGDCLQGVASGGEGRADPPGTRKADGTHPTGMLSYFYENSTAA